MSCGAEIEAAALLNTLTTGTSFTLPAIDLNDPMFEVPGDTTSALYSSITRLTNNSLTNGEIDGPGTFDALMRGFKGHLREEYEKGRITGADYTKAYIELTQGAMQHSVAFLLGREASFWAAQAAQVATIMARVQLQSEKVKVVALQYQALTAKAEYGLTAMKISSESMNYCLSKYNLEYILPAQRETLIADAAVKTYTVSYLLPAQKLNTDADTSIKTYTASSLLPAQKNNLDADHNHKLFQTAYMLPSQKSNIDADTQGKLYTVNSLMPMQLQLTTKQMELYAQQIISYQRDAEVKAAKLFTDAWITMKTLDEELAPPNNFTNDAINDALAVVRNNNGMG